MSSLSVEKLKECKIIFDLIDKDKDGKLSNDDLGDALRVCGAAPSQQEIEMILQANGNDLIPFEKFISYYEQVMHSQESEEEIINEFKKMDKTGKGTISINDLKNLLSNYGNTLTKEEVDFIIQESKAEGGLINIEKFTKILLGNS